MRPSVGGRSFRMVSVLLLIPALLLLAGCQKDASWKVGIGAPEISLFDLKDQTVKLSSFRGKVVVLRFWSSGCKDCVAGMPAMERYSRKFQDRGLQVIAVNLGESREKVEGFVNRMQLGYPVLRDPELIAAKKYHVTAVPTTFFIDRKGTAKLVVPGEVTQQLFDREVASLL